MMNKIKNKITETTGLKKYCLNYLIDNFETKQEIEDFISDLLNHGCVVTFEYFELAVKIFKAVSEERFKIFAYKDYPIKLESEHFDIVIAPRVETD